MAGDETGTGDETGDDPFVDGLGVGETYATGGLAGDLAGKFMQLPHFYMLNIICFVSEFSR
jgi:hypothetical protein